MGHSFWEALGRPCRPTYLCCKLITTFFNPPVKQGRTDYLFTPLFFFTHGTFFWRVNTVVWILTEGFCLAHHYFLFEEKSGCFTHWVILPQQEFLKKEYSHENIYFWTACERYKRLTNPEELRVVAKQIFERHLYSGAPEPVNVDSQARQDAQDGLQNPNEFLFAQVRSFNLYSSRTLQVVILPLCCNSTMYMCLLVLVWWLFCCSGQQQGLCVCDFFVYRLDWTKLCGTVGKPKVKLIRTKDF